jgi:hypothetical protein
MRRLADLGLSGLWNEAYDVKAGLDAGDGLARKNSEKWQWVAVFGMVSCQFKMY